MLITPFDKCKYLKTDDAIINIINGPLNPDNTIKNKSCAFHNFDLGSSDIIIIATYNDKYQ